MIEPRITQDSTQMTKVMAHVHRNATETSRNAKDVVKIIVDELVSPCKKKRKAIMVISFTTLSVFFKTLCQEIRDKAL
jgi:hypothetical protein